MENSFDYGKAYKQISRDLKTALLERDILDSKITNMRKTLASLAAVCESEGIEVEPSPEAEFLLETTGLTDEVMNVVRAECPAWLSPVQIKSRLERLGHDMSKYKNPMATVHMVLKRLLEAKPPRIQQHPSEDGTKTLYRSCRDMSEFALAPLGGPERRGNALAALGGAERSSNDALAALRNSKPRKLSKR